jgi:hypothetical protein
MLPPEPPVAVQVIVRGLEPEGLLTEVIGAVQELVIVLWLFGLLLPVAV